MAIFLVDYENVHDGGMEGVTLLQGDNKLVVMYSNVARSISFERHIELMRCASQFEYIKCDADAIQMEISTYLGFMIGKGESGPFYIVSQNEAMDGVVGIWRNKGVNVSRIDAVCNAKISQKARTEGTAKKAAGTAKTAESTATSGEADPIKGFERTAEDLAAGIFTAVEDMIPPVMKMGEEYKKKVREAVKDDGLNSSSYAKIYKTMMDATTPSHLKKKMEESFGLEEGAMIFNQIKTAYEELKKDMMS